MTVAVRDHCTHEPVAGARVSAAPVHFFLPMHPYPILDLNAPTSVRAVTGDDGTATLKVVVDHPVRLLVAAAGYQPLVMHVEEHPASGGDTTWIDADPELPQGDGPRLEVKLTSP